MSAFFLPEGDRGFLATEHTRGPWSAGHQHGGPPAALMARAIERRRDHDPAWPVARMTVDFLRPIPIGRVRCETSLQKPGRRADIVRASLFDEGEQEVARARCVRIRSAPVDLPPLPDRAAPPPPPEGLAPFVLPFFPHEVGYHQAVDVRIARGEFGRGRVAAWLALKLPVVRGEEPTPFQRVMAVTDSGHGVSIVLDLTKYTFVNPDLTVYLHRYPDGPWICLDAHSLPEPHGIGLATARLFDRAGPIGRSLQSLVVEKR